MVQSTFQQRFLSFQKWPSFRFVNATRAEASPHASIIMLINARSALPIVVVTDREQNGGDGTGDGADDEQNGGDGTDDGADGAGG